MDVDGPVSQRSSQEIIIRFFAAQLFSMTAFGRLTSLVKFNSWVQLSAMVILFLCPVMYPVLVAINVLRAIKYWYQCGSWGPAPWTFYLGAILGAHVVAAQRSDNVMVTYSLFDAGHVNVRKSKVQMTPRWVGRLILCACDLVLASGTLVLHVRRRQFDWDRCIFDLLSGYVAFGAGTASLASMIIEALSLRWEPAGHQLAIHGTYSLDNLRTLSALLGVHTTISSLAMDMYALSYFPEEELLAARPLGPFIAILDLFGESFLIILLGVTLISPFLLDAIAWTLTQYGRPANGSLLRGKDILSASFILYWLSTYQMLLAMALGETAFDNFDTEYGVKDPWSDLLFVI